MMAAESALASSLATARISSTGTPQRWDISSTSTAASASRSASKSRVRSCTKAASTSPSLETIEAAKASRSQTSVPGAARTWRSAARLVSVSRGSTTTRRRSGSSAKALK